MQLSEYQTEAIKTAIYPADAKLLYPLLGLAGEAGEVLQNFTDKIDFGNNFNLKNAFTAFVEAAKNCEKVKKLIRDTKTEYIQNEVNDIKPQVDVLLQDEEFIKETGKEIGGNLWYVSAVANDLGLSLGDIGDINIAQLKSRQERGKLNGSGSNR